MARKKLKGDELQRALQDGHLRRMKLRRYGSHNDHKLCQDCGNLLDPSEKCNCA